MVDERAVSRIEEIRAEIARGIGTAERLTEHSLWSRTGPALFSGAKLSATPSFYPVYRWRDTYAWSVLPLVVLKGSLTTNPRAVAAARAPGFIYFGSNETIDRDIERVGGPLVRADQRDIVTPDSYAREMTSALCADLAEVESLAGDAQQFILVGGRDSLNLLLVPWRRPPVALSAAPNFSLVADFVRRNGLAIEVRELTDPEEPDVLSCEVLENGCRANLEHYRWGACLRAIAREHEGAVFWKGQLGDVVMTPFWKKYCHPRGGRRELVQKVYARTDRLLPAPLRRAIGDYALVPLLLDALWRRGAMWQGHHMSVLRALTNRRFLSAYHGPRVQALLRRVDFVRAASEDIRPRIGALLLGREVTYPSTNPGPTPSHFRRGLAAPERYFDALRAGGISVVG